MERLEIRKERFLQALSGQKFPNSILLVGDRPGPSAPTDPAYHHTPFYSTKHCSGWLNRKLDEEGIDEPTMVWINAADRLGNPSPARLIQTIGTRTIIALGGNAEKWLRKSGVGDFCQVTHPQFHKRFCNKEPYLLFALLKLLTRNQSL